MLKQERNLIGKKQPGAESTVENVTVKRFLTSSCINLNWTLQNSVKGRTKGAYHTGVR
jgi:hypothetical protein